MAVGFVLWFTGLSGAGKSTLCAMVAAELRRRGVHVETLDGDEVRKNLSKGLGFSKEDRDENVRRLGFVARVAARSGACAITAAISPYRSVREEIRAQTPRFCEVYCKCPVAVLTDRDPKGLYQRALRGEIKNFTGIDDPYEEPENPDVLLHTDRESPAECAQRILQRLEQLGFIDGRGAAQAERALLPPHGGVLEERAVDSAAASALRERAQQAPQLLLDESAQRAVRALASGALSPLKGFFGHKDFLRVHADMRLERGLFWPVPLLLPLSDSQEQALRGARDVSLCSPSGQLLAVLEGAEVWRDARAGSTAFLAGEVWALGASDASVARLRARLVSSGSHDVTAFAAQSMASLGDEHLLRAALEFCSAIAVVQCGQPLADRSYEVLLRDYFPEGRAWALPSPGIDAPSDVAFLLLAAIVAQNSGCSRLLVAETLLGAPVAGTTLREWLSAGAASELLLRIQPHAAPARSERLAAVVSTRTAPDPHAISDASQYRPEVLALMSERS